MSKARDLFGDALDPSLPQSGTRRVIMAPAWMQVEATFSECGRYRYGLRHRWAPGPLILFAMMNPSDAGRRIGGRWTTDMTVAKTNRMALRLGFGASAVANACGLIATDSARLLHVEDPVGPGNAAAIKMAAEDAFLVVVAHGRLPGGLQHHADAMCSILRRVVPALHVLKLTADGVPMHPLARGRNHVEENAVPFLWHTPSAIVR